MLAYVVKYIFFEYLFSHLRLLTTALVFSSQTFVITNFLSVFSRSAFRRDRTSAISAFNFVAKKITYMIISYADEKRELVEVGFAWIFDVFRE